MICPSCCNQNLPGAAVCDRCKQPLTFFDLPTPENAIERRVMQDHVTSLKQRTPVTIPDTGTVADAIERMIANNVGAVLIVDGQGSLAGIFSERDMLKKIAGQYTNYAELPIVHFMTPRPECVSSTKDTLNFVLQKMDGGGYRHVPVLDNGKPVNIVSVRDMLRFMIQLCRDA